MRAKTSSVKMLLYHSGELTTEKCFLFSERILSAFLKREMGRYLQLDTFESLHLPAPQPGKKYLLYIHIPFCERLCPYCSFNRFLFEPQRALKYFHHLRQEMHLIADLGYDFSAAYFGGGTPTVLIHELCATMDLARELFHINEISCETNPDHLRPEIIDPLQGRVQRLSVGMQSFDDGLLKQMNRYDKYGSGEENLHRFQRVAGLFPTFNVDMIFNFPSQDEKILRQDLRVLIECGASQTTFYPLMTAPSVARTLALSVGQVNHRREAFFYKVINQELIPAFQPVSAWSFSRFGKEMIDEYIVDHEEYLGIGSGSFSYLAGNLFVNTFSLREYAERLQNNQLPTLKKRPFRRHEQMRYRFLMELFGLQLDKKRFQQTFGVPIDLGLMLEMSFMKLSGAFERGDSEKITLTPVGRYLLVAMMREFFSSMDKVREQARLGLSDNEARELLGDYC